jgi:hypothetical protein
MGEGRHIQVGGDGIYAIFTYALTAQLNCRYRGFGAHEKHNLFSERYGRTPTPLPAATFRCGWSP